MLNNDSTEQEVVALENGTEVDNEVTDEELDLETDELEEVEEKVIKPKQSREDNERFKAARRKAEQESEAKIKQANDKLQAVLKTVGVDSYEELMNADYTLSVEERRKYEIEAENKGKDVDDYIEAKENKRMLKYIIAQKNAEAANNNIKKAVKSKTDSEIEEFNTAYPNINVDSFLNNKKVSAFADGKMGKYSITQIADNYFDTFGASEDFTSLKNERSTSTGNGNDRVGLSAVDRVALNEYNTANPDCKMTAKDFLKYRNK